MVMARPHFKKILIGFILSLIVLFIWNENPRQFSEFFPEDFVLSFRKSRDTFNKTTESTNPQTTTYDRNQYPETLIDIDHHMPDINKLYARTVLVTAISQNHYDEVRGMIEPESTNPQTTGRNQYPETRIDIDNYMPDINELYARTVLVTAISQNHYDEVRGMIASAQKHMPQNRIVVYDLGLKEWTKQKLKKLCNVEVRPFKFNNYPGFIKSIHTYSWKPLIIQETLKEFGAIFYGDSSVRFTRSLLFLYPRLKDFNGFMQHIHSFDPRHKEAQYFMTHPRTFMELKVNRLKYRNDVGLTPWISAGRVLYVNSSSIHEKIISPMVECALRKSCIAPDGGHRGKRAPNAKTDQSHSHRFDSSVLSLLVYKNMYGFYNENHDPTKLHSASVKIARSKAEIYAGHTNLQRRPHCHIRG